MDNLVSPLSVEIVSLNYRNVIVAGPEVESPRIQNGVLERLRVSWKGEITSEIKGSLLEFQKILSEIAETRIWRKVG